MPFPYSSLTDRACLSPDFPLPPKEAFRNDLRNEDVDEEEWQSLERAKERWRITNFRGLHDLYLATDVLALADCLDNYRKGFRELHGTDVLHYLTLPKASW